MFATRIIADKRSQCKKLILRIPSSNGGAALYMVAVDIIYMLPSDKKKKYALVLPVVLQRAIAVLHSRTRS